MWKNDLEIWEMAQAHGTQLKYLKNGLTMFEMA